MPARIAEEDPRAADTIIVDGFVALGDKPGLGMHLWKSLGRRVPVIGVAKSHFRYATPVEVLRGSSNRSLFVTAVGIDPPSAAEAIRSMHGPNRIPTQLKRADRLARIGGNQGLNSADEAHYARCGESRTQSVRQSEEL
jgi:deoxyribonuclease V